MTSHEFTIWLQGVADALGDAPPSAEQWARIRDQLKRVGATAVPAPVKIPVDFEEICKPKSFDPFDQDKDRRRKQPSPYEYYPPHWLGPHYGTGDARPVSWPIVTCAAVPPHGTEAVDRH